MSATTGMRRRLVASSLALATVVALLGSPSSVADPAENAVTHWSRISEQFVPIGRFGASAQVLSGIVHAAIYDAVAATEGGLDPFMVSIEAPPGASTEAAVATAARDVLVERVPLQAGPVTADYDAFMAAIPDGQAKSDGRTVGEQVAQQILAARADDGFGNVVEYVQQPPGPGVFEPVAPTPPIDVVLTQVLPFTFDSAWDFRPNGPSSLKSGEYAADFAEVKAYGRSDSAVRTPEQTQTVRFWADNTFVQWSRTVRALAEARDLDLRESARLLGLVHVTAADTMIACFDAKYHFSFWRPVHAIARADSSRGHRWQPRNDSGPDLDIAPRRQPPGVSVRARMPHRRGDPGAPDLLRNQRSAADDLQQLPRGRAATILRAAQRHPSRGGRRAGVGGTALPQRDGGGREARSQDRSTRRLLCLPLAR